MNQCFILIYIQFLLLILCVCVLQDGYWGLSEDPQGCKACDCDVGGAYDNNCDQSTGQCSCKPSVIGRQCNKVSPGYFITDLDYLRYEGEFASGIGVSLPPLRVLLTSADSLESQLPW